MQRPEPPPVPAAEEGAQSALTFHVFRAKARWFDALCKCPGCDSPHLEVTTSNYRSYSMAGGGGRGLHDVTHTCAACGWQVHRRNVVQHNTAAFTPDRLLKMVAETSDVWQVAPWVVAEPPGGDGGTVRISEAGELEQALNQGCSPAGRAACSLAAELLRVAHRVPMDEIAEDRRAAMRLEVVRCAVDGAAVSRVEDATPPSHA